MITHKWWLLLWIIVNCGPMWVVIATNRRSKPDPKVEPKYRPFVRADYDNWSYFHAIWTHFFYIPRLALCMVLFSSVALVAKLVFIFNRDGTQSK